jgi:hypothetical protein
MNSYLHVNGQNRLRQRTYTVHHHVKYGYRFQNVVKHPSDSRWGSGSGGWVCGVQCSLMGVLITFGGQAPLRLQVGWFGGVGFIQG